MKEIGVALVINDKLEENLKWAKNAGFANCQLQIWDMGLLYEEHARQIKKLTDTYAMEITGLWCGWHGPVRWDFLEGPSVLGIVPAEYRAGRTRNLLDGAAYGRILGVSDIITHLGFVPLNCRDENYTGVVSALKYITGELKPYNQNLLMETGQEPPIVLKRLIEDVKADNLGINYDPANLMMYGSANPVDGIKILGSYIRSVHAKDGSYPTDGYELGKEYPIGEGEVDFPGVFNGLKALGYKGPISVEYEIESGDEKQRNEMIQGKQYLEKLV